jgi:hypothetical protein
VGGGAVIDKDATRIYKEARQVCGVVSSDMPCGMNVPPLNPRWALRSPRGSRRAARPPQNSR